MSGCEQSMLAEKNAVYTVTVAVMEHASGECTY